VATSTNLNPRAPVLPVSRKEAVYETVRRAIIEGDLQPGERLDVATIALRLGCSRMPVRDALKELEADGLVTCFPSRGTEVSRLDRADLEQIFAIRLALEKLALERAIAAMTPDDHAALRDILVRQEATTDLPAWLELNEAFHGHINAASGWPRLVAQIARERQNIERYVRARIRLDGRMQPQQQHWALLDACIERDAARGCRILEEHLSQTALRITGPETE
jgi:DNA-binding GntR family transcriptional regulator